MINLNLLSFKSKKVGRFTKLYEIEPIMKGCQQFETDSRCYFCMAQEADRHFTLKFLILTKHKHKTKI